MVFSGEDALCRSPHTIRQYLKILLKRDPGLSLVNDDRRWSMEWSTEFEETQRKQKEEKEMIEKFLSMDRHLYLFNRRIDHDERQRQEKRLAEINKERRKIHQQMQMILGVMNGERTPPKKSNGKENENRYPKSKINNQ